MLNSHNEWSPLKEVIVGSADNYVTPEIELSFQLFYTEDSTKNNFYVHPQITASDENDSQKKEVLKRNLQVARNSTNKYVDELCEDIEGLVDALKKEGVKVLRPLKLQKPEKFKTPYWGSTGIPALNVRDQAIIIGNEIIETAPILRARYFENDLLKPVFYQYFKNNQVKWTLMPRPMMLDKSFDLSDVDEGFISRPWEDVQNQQASPYDIGFELMMDAANCVRFGKDIIVNVSTQNHELAYQWLSKHLSSEYKLHRIFRMTDGHIDSMFLPLRPGLFLARNPEIIKQLPEKFQKWDVVYPPEPTENIFPEYEMGDLLLTSKYIDLNLLSINENTVVVNSLFPELVKTLEKKGFTVIPVRHRHRRIFGGGFHCFTLDTCRDSKLEDYFS